MPAFCSLLFNQPLSTFIFICSLSYVAFICITSAVSLLTEGKTIIIVFFSLGCLVELFFSIPKNASVVLITIYAKLVPQRMWVHLCNLRLAKACVFTFQFFLLIHHSHLPWVEYIYEETVSFLF